MNDTLLSILRRNKIIAVMQGVPDELADATATALVAGCIRMIEVPMTSPGALDTIARWDELFEGRAYIGARTVLDVEMAEAAIAAGAQFLVSLGFDEGIIAYGVENAVEVWPGVMTPTEVLRSWKTGASAVKIYPAATLGPSYFRELGGPLAGIPMIAAGGIGLDNAAGFFQAGAMGIGLSSKLLDKKLIENRQFDQLTELARQYVAIATECRPAE